MTDWRNLPPVSIEEQPDVPDRVSATFLKVHDRCDRAAMLHLKHGGGPGSHPMNRGSVVHEAQRRCILELTEAHQLVTPEDEQRARELAALAAEERGYQDSPADVEAEAEELVGTQRGKVTPDHAVEVLMEVMEENPHLQMNAQERDAARMMMRNWANAFYVDPGRVIVLEQMVTLELAGFTIRCKLDLALDHGGLIEVIDTKTSWAMPSGDDFARQRYDDDGNPEGWAGDFQTMIYAMALKFGTLEDGLPLPPADQYRLVLEFPRHPRMEGLARREAYVTAQQVADFKHDLELQLRRLAQVNRDERRWQPTPGSHCSECPSPYECPLPRHMHPESQFVDATFDELVQAAVTWDRQALGARRIKERIKRRMIALGLAELRYSADQALVFQHKDSEKRKTSVAEFQAAVEAAQKYGEPFDWSDHFTYSDGTELKKRKVPRLSIPNNDERNE
jgi:hypothetical protein